MTAEEFRQVQEVAEFLCCLEITLSELSEEQIDMLIENELLSAAVKAHLTSQYDRNVQ